MGIKPGTFEIKGVVFFMVRNFVGARECLKHVKIVVCSSMLGWKNAEPSSMNMDKEGVRWN